MALAYNTRRGANFPLRARKTRPWESKKGARCIEREREIRFTAAQLAGTAIIRFKGWIKFPPYFQNWSPGLANCLIEFVAKFAK